MIPTLQPNYRHGEGWRLMALERSQCFYLTGVIEYLKLSAASLIGRPIRKSGLGRAVMKECGPGLVHCTCQFFLTSGNVLIVPDEVELLRVGCLA